jgi:hypothetical protein
MNTRGAKMRRGATIPVALAAALTVALAPSAVAGTIRIAHVDLSNLDVRGNGSVKATVTYMCPPGYAPTDNGQWMTITQPIPFSPPQRTELFQRDVLEVTCDGTTNRALARFRADAYTGKPFRAGLPLITRIDMNLHSPTEQEVLGLYDQEVVTDEAPLADVHIRSVGFTGPGVVRLVGSYTCPVGYESSDSRGVVSQAFPVPLSREKGFDRRVRCDGTWNEVAVKIWSRSQDAFQPGVMAVYMYVSASRPVPGAGVWANDGELLIVRA